MEGYALLFRFLLPC